MNWFTIINKSLRTRIVEVCHTFIYAQQSYSILRSTFLVVGSDFRQEAGKSTLYGLLDMSRFRKGFNKESMGLLW